MRRGFLARLAGISAAEMKVLRQIVQIEKEIRRYRRMVKWVGAPMPEIEEAIQRLETDQRELGWQLKNLRAINSTE